jgi:hypothetical protein
MLFPVTTLAVFGATVLAGGTKDGDVMSLKKLAMRSLFHNHPESICDFIMKTEITCANAEIIHLLLKDANTSCVQRYSNTKEGPNRLAQLLEPRLLEDERYQETLYSPTKLLVNPDLARAFFGPGEDKGCQGKGKEKVRDGESSEPVTHNDNEVKAESIDDLLGRMGGLRISEQPSKEIKSIQYGGNFFEARLSKLLEELYKADRELAMHIVGFVIEHQIDYMNSMGWLEFICIASLEDQLSVVDMLTPHEMTPGILCFICLLSGPNRKELVLRYLDEKLPENELLVRCAIAKEAKVVMGDMCNDLLGKTTDKDLMIILEGREDRSSRVALFKMIRGLGLKSPIDALLKAVFYKLTPFETELLGMFDKVDSIQEAAVKSDVPPYLWPPKYQPLEHRLKRWLTLDGPYEYVEGTDIPQEQFNFTKQHLALNTRMVTNAGRRVRVADYFIERARNLLKSPMWTMGIDDFKVMLVALSYLLADGGQLDCSNFFVDIAGDSSWDDFIEKLDKRVRSSQGKSIWNDPCVFFKFDNPFSGMWWLMSLQEFRSLVDSSYRGQMSE